MRLVLNRHYGGFSIDREMVDWLVKEKGWTVGSAEDYDKGTHDLVLFYGSFYPGKSRDSIAFRSNPDLVECVEALQKRHADWGWVARQSSLLFGLRVVELSVDAYIDDVDDGIEEVRCSIQTCYREQAAITVTPAVS